MAKVSRAIQDEQDTNWCKDRKYYIIKSFQSPVGRKSLNRPSKLVDNQLGLSHPSPGGCTIWQLGALPMALSPAGGSWGRPGRRAVGDGNALRTQVDITGTDYSNRTFNWTLRWFNISCCTLAPIPTPHCMCICLCDIPHSFVHVWK